MELLCLIRTDPLGHPRPTPLATQGGMVSADSFASAGTGREEGVGLLGGR